MHRRVHVIAMKQLAYQAQWRAYCERCEPSSSELFSAFNRRHRLAHLLRLTDPHALARRTKRDWRDAVSDEDETVLCSFQYELEMGLERFEEAKKARELHAWPARTLHPTQGLPAIGAALKVGGNLNDARYPEYHHPCE